MIDHLHELEQSVIGAVLLSPANLPLLPDLEVAHFVSVHARTVWEAIRNLEARSLPIDTATVGDEMTHARRERDDREDPRAEADAWSYLHECASRVPTIENAVEYARRVKDHALKRRIRAVIAEIDEEARNPESTGGDLLSMALAGFFSLDAEQPAETSSIGEIVKRRLIQLEEIARQRAEGITSLTGFPTGISVLDEKLGGWQPGIVSIVAARPGMGKSSLGLATADACSAKGYGVHLFSLEDTESAYADRAMSRTSNVPAESLRNSTLSRGQLDSLTRATGDLKKRKGWIVDGRSGITAQEIVRSVRRQRRANATRVVIVDYVQLISKPKHGARWSTHEHLTDAVTVLADAAKQDGMSYVVMSQLNREIEKREDRRPQMADLRESGSLEERAKCVIGIYRGAAYGKEQKRGVDYPRDGSPLSDSDFEKAVQLLVLKNSNGRTGTVRAVWNGPTTRLD